MEADQYSINTRQRRLLHWADYVLLVLTLLLSTAVGLFYAVRDRRRQNTQEFLLAGRSLHAVPVALSLAVTFTSALTLLGTPAEMYNYNTMYVYLLLAQFFAILGSAHIFVPFFYRLNILSTFEFLDQRFGRPVRVTASILFVIEMVLLQSLVLYAPCLALNAVTNLDLWGSMIGICVVVTLYTAIGGMKAVVMTDCLQAVVMLVGLLAVFIQGILVTGGMENAWSVAFNRSRIVFDDFSFDPSTRHSFWSMAVGAGIYWMGMFGANQAQVQRAVSCTSVRQAQLSLWLGLLVLWFIIVLCCLTGILMFAFYSDCHPIGFGLIAKTDQVLETCGLPSIEHMLIQCQLCWVGRIARVDNRRIPKILLYDQLKEGPRPAEGLCRRFKVCLKGFLYACDMNTNSWESGKETKSLWRQQCCLGPRPLKQEERPQSRRKESDGGRVLPRRGSSAARRGRCYASKIDLYSLMKNALKMTCLFSFVGLHGRIQTSLLPLFVMDILGFLPGLPGLFLACLFSGAFSTLSSGMNAAAAVILQDLVRPLLCCKGMLESRATLYSKIIVCLFGVTILGGAGLASMMGSVLQLVYTATSSINGPLMGVFMLGMFFPWANRWGALVGTWTAWLLVIWIGVGAFVHDIKTPLSPTVTTGCNWTADVGNVTATTTTTMATFLNTTTTSTTVGLTHTSRDPFYPMYTVSYMYYTPIGLITVVLVGMIVSCITGPTKPSSLEPKLFCSLAEVFLPERFNGMFRFGVPLREEHVKHEMPSLEVKNGTVEATRVTVTSSL